MKSYTTLIEAVEQLLLEKNKIGVLIIDEDHRASSDPNQADSHVDKRQETVVKFAVIYNLPIWLIDSNRIGLKNIVNGYEHLSIIHKGDANGFGDGHSWRVPHFANTGLDAQLQNKNITHLVVMGFHVNCCVRMTIGADCDITTYGKGALQFGYTVITSGDVLRSSATSPAGAERCGWKNVSGVSYFNSIKPSISREQFQNAYTKQYKNEFFKNPVSKMKEMLEQNLIHSIDEIEEYVQEHPTSRTAKVYNGLIS